MHDRWLKALAQGGILKDVFYLAPIAFCRCLCEPGVQQGAGSMRSLVWWGNSLAFMARHNFFFLGDPLRGTR